MLSSVGAKGRHRPPERRRHARSGVPAAVARRFPELTPPELSQALQVATAAAERNALRLH